MKLYKLIRCTTAAVMASAMALSISMPALAATWDISNHPVRVYYENGKQMVEGYNTDASTCITREDDAPVITGSGYESNDVITLDGHAGAVSVTLKNVEAEASTEALNAGGDVTITLEGNNTVSGISGIGGYADLTIKGDGSLTASGNYALESKSLTIGDGTDNTKVTAEAIWKCVSIGANGSLKVNKNAVLTIRKENDNAQAIVKGGSEYQLTGSEGEGTLNIEGITDYGITVIVNGHTYKVTSANCNDILGNGTLSYDENTLTGKGCFPALEINANGADVVLSNGDSASSPVVNGALTINDANNITVTAADGTAAVNGMLTVGAENAYASGNVTVNGQLLGGTEINCSGNVKATGSSDDGGILKTIDYNQPDIIRCNGAVYLENTGKGYTTCSLTVIGATDVTVKANGGFHAAISGEGNITCSGTVTLTTTGVRAMGSNDPLTYTPMQGGSYTVKLDDQTPFTRTGIFNESEENLLRNVKSIIITPAGSTPAPGPDDDDTTPDDTGTVDSASDAGGAVAAVLVGSAAVWGGYEIATRVILHNILPEGTAIPANRGQLALLVWNNAGRPEPAAQPAFADMDDADMAKAAQWCVEQGIMEAKTAETFKPEGWTPKLKVIEVWNKAFPKQ